MAPATAMKVHDFDYFQCVQVGRVSGWHARVEVEEEACNARPGGESCQHEPSASFFSALLVSHPCGCASLGQECRRPLEESSCHVRLQSFLVLRSFCVVSSRELDCLLFSSVCKDTRQKLQKHCRRFEVDNFNESSSDYQIFFASPKQMPKVSAEPRRILARAEVKQKNPASSDTHQVQTQ